jgi:hypothetical protein
VSFFLQNDHKSADPGVASAVDSVLTDNSCPKCGMEMEPIDNAPDGPPVEQLLLCPQCYLVTWIDDHGRHLRQGVPMKDGAPVEKSGGDGGPTWMAGEPEEC